jgi:hypothetical protein
VENTIIDGIERKCVIFKSDKLYFQRWKKLRTEWFTNSRTEMASHNGNDPPCPEMTPAIGNDPLETRNDLASDRLDWAVVIIQLKLTAFLFFLYSLQRQPVGNDCAVGIALMPSGQKRLLSKNIFLSL